MHDQSEVDSTLRWGIVFSVLWLAGIGSLIALRAGLKARRAINESAGALRGQGRAWWCLIVGGAGLAIWIPVLAISFANHL